MQLLQARCIAAQAQNYVDFYFELLLKMNITKKTYSDLWITAVSYTHLATVHPDL